MEPPAVFSQHRGKVPANQSGASGNQNRFNIFHSALNVQVQACIFACMSNMKYHKHIFICNNQRTEGGRPSCGHDHGLALVAAFKKAIKDKQLNVPVRAQKAGCLDICELGPSVVVYPDGVFYGKVQLADVQEIVDEHIVNNRPLERLKLDFPQNIEQPDTL